MRGHEEEEQEEEKDGNEGEGGEDIELVGVLFYYKHKQWEKTWLS